METAARHDLMELEKKIHNVATTDIKITIISPNYPTKTLNYGLKRLLQQRKEIAQQYVQTNLSEDLKITLLELFETINKEILLLIGI